jgi:hypothetical protein
MVRNIILGVALCPPLAAILLVLVSLVFGLFMAHPPISPTAPVVPSTYSNPGFSPLPGMFFTIVFLSYFFGWLPCLIIGLGNGVADVVVQSSRNRLLLAPVIGAFVAYTTLLLIPASGTVWEHIAGATPFAIAAALASLTCAAIANKMRAGQLRPTPA